MFGVTSVAGFPLDIADIPSNRSLAQPEYGSVNSSPYFSALLELTNEQLTIAESSSRKACLTKSSSES